MLPSCSLTPSPSYWFPLPSLYVSLSVTPTIHQSVFPCVFISLYFCFPLYRCSCLTRGYSLEPHGFSLPLPLVLTRVRAPLSLASLVFLSRLVPPPRSQSFATEENYSLSILETPTPDHETNFFHRGEFPLPAYIRILFLLFSRDDNDFGDDLLRLRGERASVRQGCINKTIWSTFVITSEYVLYFG